MTPFTCCSFSCVLSKLKHPNPGDVGGDHGSHNTQPITNPVRRTRRHLLVTRQGFGASGPLLGLRHDGPSVGFDRTLWSIYVGDLNARGIKVGLIQGDSMRIIQANRPKDPCKVESTPIKLQPELLVGRCELERFARMATSHPQFDALVERLGEVKPSDIGTIYVYEVASECYEVDWELTTVTPQTFEAMALTAHLAEAKLSCRLVLPKPRRGRSVGRPRPALAVSEPIPYGQIRLPF